MPRERPKKWQKKKKKKKVTCKITLPCAFKTYKHLWKDGGEFPFELTSKLLEHIYFFIMSSGSSQGPLQSKQNSFKIPILWCEKSPMSKRLIIFSNIPSRSFFPDSHVQGTISVLHQKELSDVKFNSSSDHLWWSTHRNLGVNNEIFLKISEKKTTHGLRWATWEITLNDFHLTAHWMDPSLQDLCATHNWCPNTVIPQSCGRCAAIVIL